MVEQNRFRQQAVEWLRFSMDVATHVQPNDKIEDESGIGRVEGFVRRPNKAGQLGYVALCMFVFGIVLAMFGMPGVSATDRAAVNGLGYATQVAAGVVMIAAIGIHRHNRTPVVVELHGQPAGAVDVSEVAALRKAAGDKLAWVVAESGVTPDAIARADALGVRCFELGSAGPVERTKPPGAT